MGNRCSHAAERRTVVLCVSVVCALLAGIADARAPARPAGVPPLNTSISQPTTEVPTSVAAFEELLHLIPDTPDARRSVVINDYARLRALRDVAAPADLTDPTQKQAQIDALRAPGVSIRLLPTFVSGMSQYSRLLHIEQYLGYRRVDQDIAAGLPPNMYTAVRGEFDPRAADQAIAACGECPTADRDEFEGLSYYGWGEDFAVSLRDRLLPPAFDETGRGGRLAITDRYVLRAIWTDGIRAMIAAMRGAPSLTDDEAFRLAAAAGGRLGSYYLVITERTQGPDEAVRIILATPDGARQRVEFVWRPSAGTPVLEPYVVLAMGAGLDDAGEPYTSIVLVHDDEEAARANAGLLPRRIAETASTITGRPWSDVFTAVELEVDGRVLTARLHGQLVAEEFWLVGDPLLLHR